MKRFSLILIAFVLLLPVMAQEDAASAAFERLVPSNVRLRLDEETGIASLVFNANPAVCEELVMDITVEANVIDVDAYVPLSAQGATCNFIAPYEPIIELGELEPDVSYVLLLNDYATTFFLPQVGGIVMDMPFTTVWGQDNALIGFTRVDSFVDTVEVTSADDVITVTGEGSHPDGCESELFSWLRKDDIDPLVYHVEFFRLIPEGVMCPMSLQEFTSILSIESPTDDGSFYLEISDKWFSLTSEAVNPFVYTPISVDTVNIVANEDSFDVTVAANGSECGLDTYIAQASREYASFINIAMINPPDTECVGETQYQETFIVETLPVIVNGLAYDENGVLSPLQSQAVAPDSGASRGGENLMPVDTVIESVDVLILESFPMQLDLVVTGYQPDGCDFPVVVEQSREGNVVTVHVYREVPSDVMCTMMIVPYEETIRLEGGFEGGTIEIHVNEFTTSVDL